MIACRGSEPMLCLEGWQWLVLRHSGMSLGSSEFRGRRKGLEGQSTLLPHTLCGTDARVPCCEVLATCIVFSFHRPSAEWSWLYFLGGHLCLKKSEAAHVA